MHVNRLTFLLPFISFFCLISACVTPLNAPAHLPLSDQQKADLIAADVIILGEIHDNPEHHLIQAELLRNLAAERGIAAIYLEQVPRQQQAILSAVSKENLDQAGERLEWQKSGWPDFALYRPIFEAALDAHIPLVGANIPVASSKSIYTSGYDGVFSKVEQDQVGLMEPLPPEASERLKQSIIEGHCNMIPADHAVKMIPIQRARDAAMALSFLAAKPQRTPVIYIVGAGHARKDFGIPWYIKRAAPQLKVWSLGLGEVGQDEEKGMNEVYDHWYRTKAASRDDPCLKLEKSLHKK